MRNNQGTHIVLWYDNGFQIDGKWHSLNAIADDLVEEITASLNDGAERQAYSPSQVKDALWSLLEDHIEDYLEDLGDYWDRLSSSQQYRYLGEPEVNLEEEARLEQGDREYDKRHGN